MDSLTTVHLRATISTPAAKKLPVWATIAETYRTTFANIHLYLLLAWPWIAIASAGLAIAYHFASPGAEAGLPVFERAVRTVAFGWIVAVVAMVAFAPVGVRWHRWLLTGERPTLLSPFQLSPIDVRYFLAAVAFNFASFLPGDLGVLALLVALKASVPVSIMIAASYGMIALQALMFLVMLYLLRLMLVLPAIALSEPAGLGLALRRTRGHLLTILAIAIFAALPPILPAFAIGQVAGLEMLKGLDGLVALIATLAATVLGSAFAMTMVSLLYQRLATPDADEGAREDRTGEENSQGAE